MMLNVAKGITPNKEEKLPANLLLCRLVLIKKIRRPHFLVPKQRAHRENMVIAYKANLNEKNFRSSEFFPMNIRGGYRVKESGADLGLFYVPPSKRKNNILGEDFVPRKKHIQAAKNFPFLFKWAMNISSPLILSYFRLPFFYIMLCLYLLNIISLQPKIINVKKMWLIKETNKTG